MRSPDRRADRTVARAPRASAELPVPRHWLGPPAAERSTASGVVTTSEAGGWWRDSCGSATGRWTPQPSGRVPPGTAGAGPCSSWARAGSARPRCSTRSAAAPVRGCAWRGPGATPWRPRCPSGCCCRSCTRWAERTTRCGRRPPSRTVSTPAPRRSRAACAGCAAWRPARRSSRSTTCSGQTPTRWPAWASCADGSEPCPSWWSRRCAAGRRPPRSSPRAWSTAGTPRSSASRR